MITYRGLYINS